MEVTQMTESVLECHRANKAEQQVAFANVYEFWGNDLPLEEYVQWRMNSLHHQRATWYVGIADGTVAASLGVFPMHLQRDSKIEKTMFIGAVHTAPKFRRRGYAAQLIDFSEQDQQQDGVEWSFLFSDINPEYYARMGYQISDAPSVCIKPGAEQAYDTEAFQIEAGLETVKQLYTGNHQHCSCFLYRSDAYWEFLAAKHAKDHFLWLQEEGEVIGYVHCRAHDDLACLEDFAVPDHDDNSLAKVAATVSSLADQHGWNQVHGWFPDSQVGQPWFELPQRQTEITMWKSLSDQQLNSSQIRELSFFRHIDHV